MGSSSTTKINIFVFTLAVSPEEATSQNAESFLRCGDPAFTARVGETSTVR
jgi:hypothetical protein